MAVIIKVECINYSVRFHVGFNEGRCPQSLGVPLPINPVKDKNTSLSSVSKALAGKYIFLKSVISVHLGLRGVVGVNRHVPPEFP